MFNVIMSQEGVIKFNTKIVEIAYGKYMLH
jgi:hypothetical protein